MKIIIKTKSPVAHGAFGGNDLGNYSKFRRMRLICEGGTVEVPVISGNAIRGQLRRLIMTDLYRKGGVTYNGFCELLGGEESVKSKRCWDKLWAALYNGGTIDTPKNNINPTEIRNLREALPPLSLFGSALYSIMINGMVNIGFAIPQCKESVQAGITEEGILPANELLEDIGMTRHIDRENADPEVTGVKPMPYEVETLVAGTTLEAKISFAPMATEIEKSCFIYAVEMLKHLGGKSSTGFGAVDVKVETEEDTDLIDSSLYRKWLEDTDILGILFTISQEL